MAGRDALEEDEAGGGMEGDAGAEARAEEPDLVSVAEVERDGVVAGVGEEGQEREGALETYTAEDVADDGGKESSGADGGEAGASVRGVVSSQQAWLTAQMDKDADGGSASQHVANRPGCKPTLSRTTTAPQKDEPHHTTSHVSAP